MLSSRCRKCSITIQQKRCQREEEIKLKVLKTLKVKIQNYANFGQISCIYTVPNFIFGSFII